MIRPCAQGDDGLHARAESSGGAPSRHFSGDLRFEGMNLRLRFDGQALPALLGQRKEGVHGSRMVQEIESDELALLVSPT
jgi:hypothetical protein